MIRTARKDQKAQVGPEAKTAATRGSVASRVEQRRSMVENGGDESLEEGEIALRRKENAPNAVQMVPLEEKDPVSKGRKPKREKGDEEGEDWRGLVFFYESIEYRISQPKTKANPLIGVRWMRGVLKEKDFRRKVKHGRGNHQVQLDTFEDAPIQDTGIDRCYYNSDLLLGNFEDADAVRKDVKDYISGHYLLNRNQAPLKKTGRRKRKQKEERIHVKQACYSRSKMCVICSEEANKETSEVLQARCACAIRDGKTPKAFRVHVACFESKISQIMCEACHGAILLPTLIRKGRKDRNKGEGVRPKRTVEDERRRGDSGWQDERKEQEGKGIQEKKTPVAAEYDPESPPFDSSRSRKFPLAAPESLLKTVDPLPSGHELSVGANSRSLHPPTVWSIQELKEFFKPSGPKKP
jgi:hypothetical protein